MPHRPTSGATSLIICRHRALPDGVAGHLQVRLGWVRSASEAWRGVGDGVESSAPYAVGRWRLNVAQMAGVSHRAWGLMSFSVMWSGGMGPSVVRRRHGSSPSAALTAALTKSASTALYSTLLGRLCM